MKILKIGQQKKQQKQQNNKSIPKQQKQ